MFKVIVEKHFIPSSLGNDKKIKLVIKTNNNYQNALFVIPGKSLPVELGYDLKYDDHSAVDLMAKSNLTVIYIDQIGTGESSDYDYDGDNRIYNTYEDTNRDILDTINWLKENRNIDTVSFLTSSGSSIPTLMFISKYPELVNSVVVNAIPKTSKQEWEQLGLKPPKYSGDKHKYDMTRYFYRRCRDLPQDKISDFIPDDWFNKMYDTIYNHEYTFKDYHNGYDYDRYKIINGEKSLSDYINFKNITAPILFMNSEWDKDKSIKNMNECMEKISSNFKKVIDIPEATHWVMHETGRTRAIDILSKFVINLEV